ncbi:cysteine--tRNA ligase, partial [archaeon]|nr:cysteine--tRNA ligase [archaeon]
IECSAMSMKHLGEQFEVHTGGIDHISVHHPNEIAQSECAIGKKPWVKYWLHNEFLVLADGDKMAKSGENFLTLSVVENKGYSPLDFRFFNLGTHYRKQLMFSYEALDSAKNARVKLNAKVLELKNKLEVGSVKEKLESEESKKYFNNFLEDVNDDLNTPKALATLWELLKDSKIEDCEKLSLVILFDEIFGLGLRDLEKDDIPMEIIQLAEKRLRARKDKDWEISDKLRDEIFSKGFEVSDTVDSFKIKKK